MDIKNNGIITPDQPVGILYLQVLRYLGTVGTESSLG